MTSVKVTDAKSFLREFSSVGPVSSHFFAFYEKIELIDHLGESRIYIN